MGVPWNREVPLLLGTGWTGSVCTVWSEGVSCELVWHFSAILLWDHLCYQQRLEVLNRKCVPRTRCRCPEKCCISRFLHHHGGAQAIQQLEVVTYSKTNIWLICKKKRGSQSCPLTDMEERSWWDFLGIDQEKSQLFFGGEGPEAVV